MTKKEALAEYIKLSGKGEPDPGAEEARQKRVAELKSELFSKHGYTEETLDAAMMDEVAPKKDEPAAPQQTTPELPVPTATPIKLPEIEGSFGEKARAEKFGAMIKTPAPKIELPQVGTGGIITGAKKPALPQFGEAAPPIDVGEIQKKAEALVGEQRAPEPPKPAPPPARAAPAQEQERPEPEFFSERDFQKWSESKKLLEQGWSPAKIAEFQRGNVYLGATNVGADPSKLPKGFLEENNLTVTPPQGGGKMESGAKGQWLTPENEWRDQFMQRSDQQFKDPNIHEEQGQGKNMVQMPRPAQQVFAQVFGDKWNAADGENRDAVIQRRADLLRSSVLGDTAQYGVAQAGAIDRMTGAAIPQGARTVSSKYGSGFVTNPQLPAATPAQPNRVSEAILPKGMQPPEGYPVPDVSKLKLPT